MSFRRPQNPVKIRPNRFQSFDGIGGPSVQILKRFNERGWDISNSIANEVSDLNLNQSGSMILRDGCRKIRATGYSSTVTNIFQITVGNVLAFGVVAGGSLTVYDLPSINVSIDPVGLSPAPQRSSVETIRTSADPSVWYP